jgi:hypothetical protein
MNENDLRDCFAMFAIMGIVMREGVSTGQELDAWFIADKMMATRHMPTEKEELGIASIKKRKVKE